MNQFFRLITAVLGGALSLAILLILKEYAGINLWKPVGWTVLVVILLIWLAVLIPHPLVQMLGLLLDSLSRVCAAAIHFFRRSKK